MVKRALKERKEREMKEKGLKEDPSILRQQMLKKQDKATHQNRKIKTTKEIVTVAADYTELKN